MFFIFKPFVLSHFYLCKKVVLYIYAFHHFANLAAWVYPLCLQRFPHIIRVSGRLLAVEGVGGKV